MLSDSTAVKQSVESIIDLYEFKGHLQYDGEPVTQIDHAWQCGQLAKQAGASEYLQLASWLHDLGHLLSKLEGTPTLEGKDDRHEVVGSKYLENIFPEDVYLPIALHVDAKRFLVTTEPEYRNQLSLDSIRSLQLQGGIMTEKECHDFIEKPHSHDAILLRRWDDMGKKSDWTLPALDDVLHEFEDLARACV